MSVRTVVQYRRQTELTLIVMAAAIVGVAYTLASLGANSVIPARMGPFLGLVLGLIAVAHIAVRKLARGADGTLLPLAFFLHGIGFVMITRLDEELAGRQAMWSLVSIGAFCATLLFVQRAIDLARYKWTLFFVGAGLLLLPMLVSFVIMLIMTLGILGAGAMMRAGQTPEQMMQPTMLLGAGVLMVLWFVQIVLAILMLWWLTRPSDPGTNEYGPPPA